MFNACDLSLEIELWDLFRAIRSIRNLYLQIMIVNKIRMRRFTNDLTLVCCKHFCLPKQS